MLRRTLAFATLVAACSSSGTGSSTDSAHTDPVAPPATVAPNASTTADGGAGDAATTSTTRSMCFVSCTSNDDCALNGGGTCSKGMCVLGGGAETCKTDPDCVPYGSSFEIRTKCTKKADCGVNEACVAWNGKGVCQPAPTASKPCSDHFEMIDVQWPSIEGPTVTICGRTSYVCDAGKCRSGCSNDSDCTSSSYPKCDVARHKCVCAGTSCSGGTFDGEVCLSDGRCGCHSDADCNVTQGFDKCYGSTCGCSGDGACAGMVQGASLVCAPKP